MQGTHRKTSGLAIIDVEVAETEASFLEVWYSLYNSDLSC